jgi:hypothetical protein
MIPCAWPSSPAGNTDDRGGHEQGLFVSTVVFINGLGSAQRDLEIIVTYLFYGHPKGVRVSGLVDTLIIDFAYLDYMRVSIF